MVEPNTILKLANSIYPSIALFVGTQLDIFTVLDKCPSTIQEISSILKIKPYFIERMLYSLVSAELLNVKGDRFENTVEASHFLVKNKPSYLGNHVNVNPYLKHWIFDSATKTVETLRSGKAAEKFDYQKESLKTLVEIFRGTMPIAIKAGEELSKRHDFSQYSTLADVGGGHGGLAAAVARAYPNLKVTVTDLPSVTPVSKILLEEQGSTNIDVLTWDVLEGRCPRTFDVFILRALIQVLSPEQANRAVSNIGKSINSGGAIFILGHIIDDSKISPVEEVGWYFLNLNWEDEAGFFTEKDHRTMLEHVGFEEITRDTLPNGDGLIIARKP